MPTTFIVPEHAGHALGLPDDVRRSRKAIGRNVRIERSLQNTLAIIARNITNGAIS